MSVIVFGASGSVGSHVARTAHEHGAKVYLAMRDTSKTVPGLSAEQEKQGNYVRVSADLTKNDTITAAVKQSGAKRAFIYLIHHASDHMKSALETLKAAGIDTVVFLSSYTITKEPYEELPEDIIPYIHAQVEVQLQNIFGPKGYVAIRPGFFATNSIAWWLQGIKAGEVKMFAPNVKFDMTPPADMGGVAGVILAKGSKDGKNIVYVFGPQFISQKEAFEILTSALTKPVKLTIVTDAEQHAKNLTSNGIPPPIATYLANFLAASEEDGSELDEFVHLKEGQQNVQKYLNRPGVTFEDWVEQNKATFE